MELGRQTFGVSSINSHNKEEDERDSSSTCLPMLFANNEDELVLGVSRISLLKKINKKIILTAEQNDLILS